VADASADVVYSSHMVEHLDRDEAGQFLREAMRVLTPGGTLRIAVPNLQWHVGNYLASANADDFMAQTRLGRTLPKTFAAKLRAMVFGVRGDHVWMYDERSLARLLEQAGFARVKACPPGQTRIAEPGALNLTERFPESIFVEGTKP
jgi:predicted SAM-dependent methyltransferase